MKESAFIFLENKMYASLEQIPLEEEEYNENWVDTFFNVGSAYE